MRTSGISNKKCINYNYNNTFNYSSYSNSNNNNNITHNKKKKLLLIRIKPQSITLSPTITTPLINLPTTSTSPLYIPE